MSPLYERYKNMGDNIPNVTYIPSKKLYVMMAIQTPSTYITMRTSPDGFNWTEPVGIIGAQKSGIRHMYPRMHVVKDAGGAENYVLTYLRKSETGWTFAELVQQPLEWK
jgi:hypothetical protein